MKKLFFTFLALITVSLFSMSLTSCGDDEKDIQPSDTYTWGVSLTVVKYTEASDLAKLRSWLDPRVEELKSKYSGKGANLSDAETVKAQAVTALKQLKVDFEAYLKSIDNNAEWNTECEVSFCIEKGTEKVFTHVENFVIKAGATRLTYNGTFALKVAGNFIADNTYDATAEFDISETEKIKGEYIDKIVFDIDNSHIYKRATGEAFGGPKYLTGITYDYETHKVKLAMQFVKEHAASYKGQHYFVIPVVVANGATEAEFELIVNVDIDQ